MAGVAFNGSSVSQSTKSGHVTYKIERYVEPWIDDDGYTHGGYWQDAGNGSTNALITSSGVSSSSTVYVNGKPIAKVDDPVPESWVASPSVPSSNSSYRYTPNGATSGSGQGRVKTGSSKVFANGKQVAFIGSEVETMLSTTANITNGSSNVFVN